MNQELLLVKNQKSIHSIENIDQESYFTEKIIKFRDLITKGEYPRMKIFYKRIVRAGTFCILAMFTTVT